MSPQRPLRFVKRLCVLTCGVLVAISGASLAQSLAPAWQAQFDGPAHQDDIAHAVAVLPSGAIAVAGKTWAEPQPTVFVPQFFTALYSAQGQELWSLVHGSVADSAADQVAITPAGKIISAGTRNLGAEWIAVQYDASGAEEWEGAWVTGSTFIAHVADLDIDDTGDIYLCGDISSGAGLIKFNSTGALLWIQTYQGTGIQIGSIRALAINAAGNVFVTGTTSGASGEQLFSVGRIDPVNGLPLWVRHYGPASGFSFSEGGGLGTDGAGNAIACGRVSDYLSMGLFITFVALAPDGTLVWRYDRDRPTAAWGVVEDLVVDASGNIAAAGWTASPAFDIDGFVLRMNGGAFAWERAYAGSALQDDRAVAVKLDALGNTYAAGWVRDPDPGFDVFEYSPAGGLIAHGRAPAPVSGNAYARDLAIAAGGRAYGVGDMQGFPLAGGDAVTAAFDLGPPVSLSCFGDGSGALCPCGNASAVGAHAGCLSSIGSGGKLTADGAAHVGADTFTLHATDVPDGPGLYFQGTSPAGGGSGVAFGDGLLCVSGAIVRLGVVFAANNASAYPGGSAPAPISVGGACLPGDTRQYQVWYRDADPSFCTSAVFNLTSALDVTWVP